MGNSTVRISASAHRVLREMAKAERRPMLTLLDEAVETLRRQRFLTDVNLAYASLRADPEAWRGIEDERRAWDVTLPDGLAVAEKRPSYGARARSRRRRKRP
jgi:hypothetical protein